MAVIVTVLKLMVTALDVVLCEFLIVTSCREDLVLLHDDRWSCSSSMLKRVWFIVVLISIIHHCYHSPVIIRT